ncbi:MAG: TadE/TadG family type IV pilus assembly protein [Acidimicrobiia bacterium]
MTERLSNRRLRGERGAAVVELSICLIVIVVIVFGVVSYGVILSFKQTMTQAAAEGARAGAMGTNTTASGLASNATAKSLGAFGKTCGSGGLTCTFTVNPCVPGPPSAKCIEVDLVYDYQGHPLLPPLPFISSFLPTTLRSTFESEVNS